MSLTITTALGNCSPAVTGVLATVVAVVGTGETFVAGDGTVAVTVVVEQAARPAITSQWIGVSRKTAP
ncbi:MAG TPA: hypothetical protein VIH55_03890 [Acidimicrobiia bacterium]